MRTSTLVIFLLGFAVLLVVFFNLNARNNRRHREGLYEAFETTMRQHGVKSFVILKESISIGNIYRLSGLYLLLIDDSGQPFLYLHASGTQPIFRQVTEERDAQGEVGVQA